MKRSKTKKEETPKKKEAGNTVAPKMDPKFDNWMEQKRRSSGVSVSTTDQETFKPTSILNFDTPSWDADELVPSDKAPLDIVTENGDNEEGANGFLGTTEKIISKAFQGRESKNRRSTTKSKKQPRSNSVELQNDVSQKPPSRRLSLRSMASDCEDLSSDDDLLSPTTRKRQSRRIKFVSSNNNNNNKIKNRKLQQDDAKTITDQSHSSSAGETASMSD